MKLADIMSVFKKDDRNSKSNYRPISIFSNLPKVLDKIMHDQISIFFLDTLSKYHCGFRKGFSTQFCLIAMIEKWKKSVDNKGTFGTLLTDLPIAFDCIPYELLIAKLCVYGSDFKALKFMYSYINNRKQRVRINKSLGEWPEMLYGEPQGSILGPLLLIIFLCDLFYFEEHIDIASYVNQNTLYSAYSNIENTISSLESSAQLINSFQQNAMKANPDKCHLLFSTNQNKLGNINSSAIHNSSSEKLLGITIDINFKCDIHVNNRCKKTSQKLNACTRIASLMNVDKIRSIMKSFIISHFKYCPLARMFHDRSLNNKINGNMNDHLNCVW